MMTDAPRASAVLSEDRLAEDRLAEDRLGARTWVWARMAIRRHFPVLRYFAAAFAALACDARCWRWRFTRRRAVAAWLNGPGPRLLHLGAGAVALAGWLNTDIDPRRAVGAVFMNAAERFPLPDNSVDAIFSEHMIEHLPYREGQSAFRECYRVLRPGGQLRIATPDLTVLLALHRPAEQLDATQTAYVRYIVDWSMPDCSSYDPVFVINNAFRAWGHQFLYDERILKFSLENSGFKEVERVPVGRSRHPPFDQLESHGKASGHYAMAVVETMVLEARKPG